MDTGKPRSPSRSRGKADNAESNYADAVAEYEKICGATSYETAEARYRQSGCLLRMGKLAPAEAAIRRAISVMDSVSDLSDPEKSDYLSTLASILEATGRKAEASEMRDRAERLFEQAKRQSETQE